MDELGKGSLEDRVERLESALKTQDRELRYALRRLNRVLADRGFQDPRKAGLQKDRAEKSPPHRLAEEPAVPPSRTAEETAWPPGAATLAVPYPPRTARPPEPADGEHEDVPRRSSGHGEDDPGGERWWLRRPFDPGDLRSGEWWLSKIGIALLLFGVAFLFQFSWDRGWLRALLTPPVRVGIGLSIGAALTWLGLRVYEDRRAFSRVLLGGGIGTFYITGFAAFRVFGLVPYAVAFAFMVSVTLLAFALSLRQDGASLALIGALGGFATPFVLYAGDGSVGGLVLYACLILAGCAAIYVFKGWRSLLLASFAGVWAIFLIGYEGVLSPVVSTDEQWTLQIGVVFAWLVLWLAPAWREVLRDRNPARWPLPEPGGLVRSILGDERRILDSNAPAHALSVATPLVGLLLTRGIWDLDKVSLGWVVLGGAVVYALAALGLRSVEAEGRMSYTQALTALLLGTLAVVLLLRGDALLFALAAEAAVLHLLSRRLSDRVLSWEAHALSAVVGTWLGVRLIDGVIAFDPAGTAVLDLRALTDLAVMLLALPVSRFSSRPRVAAAYRLCACGAFSVWLLRELGALGDGYVLLAWTVYACGLLLSSRRWGDAGLLAAANLQFAAAGALLLPRLLVGLPGGPEGTPVLGFQSLIDLCVILSAALASRLISSRDIVAAYRLAAHAALLSWLWRELLALPGSAGDAYVTIAWGLYAAGLLVAGLRLDHTQAVRGGMATLFLVVAKLFLWDLAGVDAIWRILLFLGFGGLFLLLGYHLQALWRPDDRAAGGSGERDESARGRS